MAFEDSQIPFTRRRWRRIKQVRAEKQARHAQAVSHWPTAWALTASGLSLRRTGMLLGVSSRRVSQMRDRYEDELERRRQELAVTPEPRMPGWLRRLRAAGAL